MSISCRLCQHFALAQHSAEDCAGCGQCVLMAQDALRCAKSAHTCQQFVLRHDTAMRVAS